jgi:hypothetical protein
VRERRSLRCLKMYFWRDNSSLGIRQREDAMECGCIRLGANRTTVPVACSLRHRSLGLFWMESFLREILLRQI